MDKALLLKSAAPKSRGSNPAALQIGRLCNQPKMHVSVLLSSSLSGWLAGWERLEEAMKG